MSLARAPRLRGSRVEARKATRGAGPPTDQAPPLRSRPWRWDRVLRPPTPVQIGDPSSLESGRRAVPRRFAVAPWPEPRAAEARFAEIHVARPGCEWSGV